MCVCFCVSATINHVQAIQRVKHYNVTCIINAISRLTRSNIFHVSSYFIAINVDYELDIIYT